MPDYVIRKLTDALNAQKKPLNGSKILLVGLAYKANVVDERESPGFVLMDIMKNDGAEVSYYDPYIPVIKPTREHAHWAGVNCIDWNEKAIRSFYAVLVSTAHANVNYEQQGAGSQLLVDTRNALNLQKSIGIVVKA